MVKSRITTRPRRTESFLDSLPHHRRDAAQLVVWREGERQNNRLSVWLLGLDVIRASELQKEPAFIRCDLMIG